MLPILLLQSNALHGGIMNRLPKLPKETRAQLGFGVFLIILSIIWLSLILVVMTPDHILPTREHIRTAYEAFMDAASVSANQWSLNTIGALIGRGFSLVVLDILFIVARYGGLTLLFLGGVAVFEAISTLRSARR